MPVNQLAMLLFKKLDALLTQVNFIYSVSQGGMKQIQSARKTQKTLCTFLECINEDKLIQRLFQFAVCCSMEQSHQQLEEILQNIIPAIQAPSDDNGVNHQKARPSLYDIIPQIKKYLERCLAHQSLNLTHLARIETKLQQEFDFPHFSDLGHGTFLDLMANSVEIKQFLEDNGGGSFGLSPTDGGMQGVYQPSQHDLLYFIWQCGLQVDQLTTENALCYHYGSPEVRALGHGSLANLKQNLERNQDLGQNSCVLFESALVAKSRNPCLSGKQKTGILGHMTKEKALICLQNCPLLEDLHEWSQWDVVFEPELGHLKDFIQKYGGTHVINLSGPKGSTTITTSVLALETRPGVLLKVTSDTSPDKLATASMRCDARETCGHLTSMIVVNSGVENTPLMLLGNHVKLAIIRRQADQVPGGPTDDANAAVMFILDCLTVLPKLICLSVAEKVFLEPLSEVIGQTKSHELLLNLATTSIQKSRLQLIEMMLGVQNWGHSFLHKVEPTSQYADSLNAMKLNDFFLADDEISEQDEEESENFTDYILSEEEDMSNENSQTAQQIEDSGLTETSSGSLADRTIGDAPESAEKDLSVIADMAPLSDVSLCKAVVDQIRREEFGIDVVLSEDGQKLMLKQQERLGRSLDRLSKDLYSKDTHFVLELIQNADDNDYPDELYSDDSSVCPSVKFIIDDNVISVLNNECGFVEKNIRAVCDVGRTTKGKHKYGYIGQKGIGFKSVFRVTDRPEIHSNGYHICFDVKSGASGYILPHWINPDTDHEQWNSNQWTTRINLPLKPSVQTQSLAVKFHDVHPSLLLFLHRIKFLTIVNKVEGYTLEIRRNDVGKNIIEINHDGTTDLWFVIRKTLDAQKISEQAKSGVEVDSTEIAMAFPVLSKDQLLSQFQPPKQPVFAFLPLRSYGFRFVIQADFDVPSSRENIDRDSLWNQWLISELHTLFVEGLQAFKDHPEFSELDAVCRFLQFVPLEDEVLDFFRPVAAQILKHLRATPCLPAFSEDDNLTWMLPSQLILSRDQLLQEVIPSSVLQEKLNLDYLHPKVAAVLNPILMTTLGVRKISLRHLIEIRKAVLLTHSQPTSDFNEQIVGAAKWLSCIYHTMDEFQDDKNTLEELLKLPTIPLAGGNMVSLESNSVFFPPETLPQQQPLKDVYMILLQDLNMVHPKLLQCQDSVANSQVALLLENLKVRRLTPHHIINHHILPLLENNQWKTKSPNLLLAYLAYMKILIEKDPSLLKMDHLKEVVVVLTNHGPVKPSEEDVHFTTVYLNKTDLARFLPGFDWILLDECYVAGVPSETDIQRWREFFIKLGITDCVSLRTIQVSLTQTSLVHSPWADEKDLPSDLDHYILTDRQSKEAELLIRKNSQPETYPTQMKMLFEILNYFWEREYKPQALTTQICNAEGKNLKDVETSFSLLLKRTAWVLAIVTSTNENDKILLMSPHLLYARNEETKRLLANHVPYVCTNMPLNSSFAEFLGITCNVNVDMLKDLLLSWCQRTDELSKEPIHFTTSLNHMKAVYQFLYSNLSRKDFQELTDQHPIIFVTEQQTQGPTDGTFLNRHEVRWTDPSHLFSKYKASFSDLDHEHILRKPELDVLYYDISNIFKDAFQVESVPSLEAYVQLMLHISTRLMGMKSFEDIFVILTILGCEVMRNWKARTNSLEIENLKRLIGDKNCFLEKYNHKWISLNKKPMIADDVQFENLFKDKTGVYFIECGERVNNKSGGIQINSEAIKAFYKVNGVQYLSDCLDVRSVTEMYTPCNSLQKYVCYVVGYIQRILVGDYSEVYTKLQAKRTGAMLAAMRFIEVSKLEKVYTLKDILKEPVVRNEKCEINIEENEFVVHKDYVDSYNEINKQLATYFSGGNKECCMKLKLVLNELHNALSKRGVDIQSIVDEHDIKTLPHSEQAWTIPEPLTIHYPIQSPHKHDALSPNQVASTTEWRAQNADKDSSGLTAWPPNAGGSSLHPMVPGQGDQTRSSSTMWPPPKPPEGADLSQLPADLRPSKYSLDDLRRGRQQCDRPDMADEGNISQVMEQRHNRAENVQESQNRQVLELEAAATVDNGHHQPGSCVDESVRTDPDTFIKEDKNIHQSDWVSHTMQGTKHSLSSDPHHFTRRPLYLFDPTVWSDHIDEAVYEDVGTSSQLAPPETVPLSERPDQHEISVWGEQLVKAYLERLAQDPESGIKQIIWMNEDKEGGTPYDIVVKITDPDSENNTEVFVEVKTTQSNDKAFFEISAQEFEFALRVEDKYHVYRVLNAGKSDVRLKRLINLADKMRTKQVCLFLAV